jgi:hypothetical protein
MSPPRSGPRVGWGTGLLAGAVAGLVAAVASAIVRVVFHAELPPFIPTMGSAFVAGLLGGLLYVGLTNSVPRPSRSGALDPGAPTRYGGQRPHRDRTRGYWSHTAVSLPARRTYGSDPADSCADRSRAVWRKTLPRAVPGFEHDHPLRYRRLRSLRGTSCGAPATANLIAG